MPKKKQTYDLNKLITVLLLTFLIAFVGGVSGWRLAEQNNETNESSTSTIFVGDGSGSVADLVEEVSKSVVSIDAGSIETSNSYFFGTQEFEVVGSGSGIILSKDGLIVTNKHVVDESTSSISIFLSDGTEYTDVELIATDPFSDIAYLRINGVDDLTPAVLGDSALMRPGDAVIAIGNALGVYSNTVTKGIISALGRPIEGSTLEGTDSLFNLFQTDASINQGNSGGPLLNANGEVIGINTAVAGQAENIGFAIPIDDIKSSITSITKTGELQRPYIGVRFINITPEIAEALELGVDYGALVDGQPGEKSVLKDGPAEKAGVIQGDIIIKVNDNEINDTNPLTSSINGLAVGDSVQITVYRDGAEINLDLVLEAAPDNL